MLYYFRYYFVFSFVKLSVFVSWWQSFFLATKSISHKGTQSYFLIKQIF